LSPANLLLTLLNVGTLPLPVLFRGLEAFYLRGLNRTGGATTKKPD
jgi:hypothetical protein